MGEEAEFKPSPRLKTIYWLYYLWYLIPLLAILFVALIEGSIVACIIVGALIVVPTVILCIWIPRFFKSVVFKLENDHAYARFGVWWKKEKRVPYNLVSEVRVRQGPLQRALGLANVDVFTPATGAMKPELTYFQLDVAKANEIASRLRMKAGIMTQRERRIIEEEMLKELRSIRSLLEKIVERTASEKS